MYRVRFIFEKAKELGVRSVVLDGPDSWAQTMAAEGLIEKFVGLDFADADTVYNRCVDAIQSIKKVPGGLESAQTPSQQSHLPAKDAALASGTSSKSSEHTCNGLPDLGCTACLRRCV